jgi:hypothetical protein
MGLYAKLALGLALTGDPAAGVSGDVYPDPACTARKVCRRATPNPATRDRGNVFAFPILSIAAVTLRGHHVHFKGEGWVVGQATPIGSLK